MKLELEVYGALCATSVFRINGIDAEYWDFGSKTDEDPENAPDYGCGDMRFTPETVSNETLLKYGITKEDAEEIQDRLREELSFGSCGWCI